MLFVFANQSGPRDALVSFFQQVSQYIGDVIVWMEPVTAALVGGLALGFLVGLPYALAWVFDIPRTVWYFFGTATLDPYTPSECLGITISAFMVLLLVSVAINSTAGLCFVIGAFGGNLMVWALAWIVKSLPKKRKDA